MQDRGRPVRTTGRNVGCLEVFARFAPGAICLNTSLQLLVTAVSMVEATIVITHATSVRGKTSERRPWREEVKKTMWNDALAVKFVAFYSFTLVPGSVWI